MTDQQSKAIGTIELSAQVDQISKIVFEVVQSNRPLLGGEHFITNSELSALIKISRRTLQQWRTDGIIPYYQICGKVLYKESDIQELLNSYYYKAIEVR